MTRSDEEYELVAQAAEAAFGLPVTSYERDIASAIFTFLEPKIRRMAEAELLEYVESAVVQGCYGDDGLLDSMALSTWRDGIHLLAEHGRVEIIEEHGRRVVARLISEDRGSANDD